MAQDKNKISKLLHELKRRKTFQAAAAYIVFSWVLIESASVILPAFAAPLWVLPAIIIALALGLPVAVVISWIFDFTFGGFERTEPEDELSDEQNRIGATAGPAVIKPSIALPLGSARRRQVTLLRCTFELMDNGKSVADHEALLPLRRQLADLVDNTAEHFSSLCVEQSGFSCDLLFGYPTAFENDALRACAAAFSLEHQLANVHPVSRYAGATVVASIGIHSDTVIIERAGDDENAIRVVGDVSQIAAWLQTLGPAGSIILSEQTHELLRDKVCSKSLGNMRNVHASTETQVFLAESLMPHDEPGASPGHPHPEMIGRESELALLLDRWQLAGEGEDQFVLLRGDAGMGKSTLVSALIKRVANNENAQVLPFYCSLFETDNPFHPIVEYFFGPAVAVEGHDAVAAQQSHLTQRLDEVDLNPADADSLRSTLLAIASIAETSVPAGKSPVQSRRELQRCLVSYFAAMARRGHLLIILEDIQWADPSTLEVVDMILRGGIGQGQLCIFTGRTDTTFDWMTRTDVLVLDLQRLPRRATEALIRRTASGGEISNDLLSKIIAETDGNPLFAEELTRAAFENGNEEGSGLTLPGTVQQSLMSRMDRLGTAQSLLQLCSLLGKQFDYPLLLAVSETENEESLRQDLRTIVNAGLLFQEGAVPDSRYRFRHLLMQEAAHETFLRSMRVEQHARIAKIIESRFPEKVQRRPALLAYHHAEGGEPVEAVMYRIKACRKALQAYAIQEAIEQADKGLTVLQSIPASTGRDALEVTLQSQRGKGLLALRGYGEPSVERTFARALTLTEGLHDSPQIFQLVVGLWMYFFIAGEAEHAIALAQRLVGIAEKSDSPAKTMQARYSLGHSLFRLGRFSESREQLESALATEEFDDDFASESASGDDTRIHVRIVLAHVLWHLGEDAKSLELTREANTMAEELGNPFGIVFASFMSSWLFMARRNAKDCSLHAARTLHVAEERGFNFWLPLAGFMQAWASCDRGREGDAEVLTDRIESMEKSMLAFGRGGGTNGETSLALQIAEDHLAEGNNDKAATWLQRAGNCSAETGEVFMGPDISRIGALLAVSRGDMQSANKLFAEALARAKEMGSVSLAKRATESMKVLKESKAKSGRDTVQPVARTGMQGSESSPDH